jgi:DNA segregation ATPase FtsK/SpoIIIE-like protein
MVDKLNLVQSRVLRLVNGHSRRHSILREIEMAEERNGEVTVDFCLRDLLEATYPLPLGASHSSTLIKLGVNKLGEVITYDLIANPQHVALESMSRGGKASCIYLMVVQTCEAPNVIIAGLDFTGMLLNPCEALPHPELRCTSCDPMQQLQTLNRLIALMQRETARLASEGADKAAKPTREHPAVTIYLEEYPGIITAARDDDSKEGRKASERIAPKIEAAVKRLVRESAKVNFRLIILAQRFSSTSIDTDLRSNLGLRVTFREDNDDSIRMLFEDLDQKTMSKIKRFRRGEGLIGMPDGRLEHFRAYYVSYKRYKAILQGAGGVSVSESRQALQRKDKGATTTAPLCDK